MASNQSSNEGKYVPTKEFLRVYAMLIEAASQQKTLGYGDVARRMGIPTPGQQIIRPTSQICYEISLREHRYGRPMLSAIVVNVKTGIPGEGFYKLARDFGLLPENATEEQKEAFGKTEIDAVYAEWAE
ncbi:MAG: hypothetical protein ACYDAR_07550 [Thermomicrobiales bacterium]